MLKGLFLLRKRARFCILNGMSIVFIGFTLDVIGKILIAFTAIMVHHRMLNEHRIDKAVFRSMKREQRVAVVGVLFIIIGYVLQAPAKWNV